MNRITLSMAPKIGRPTAGGWLAILAAFTLFQGVAGATPAVLGDLDEDGRHTVRDVVMIVNHLQGIEFLPGAVQAFADVNEDGVLDSSDVEFLIAVILEDEQLTTIPRTVALETSPVNGEGEVGLTRETVVRFSLPLAVDAALSVEQFRAEFSGRRVLSRVEISGDRMKATLFYLENLPASARLRVTLEGEGLEDHLGRALDLDRNGVPGGDLVFDFDTVSVTPVPNTGVVGTVFAAGKAGDGSDVPLAGVIIEVVGAEEGMRATTAADGTFTLSPVPAGEFFVNIDGRPVTGEFPDGEYYPFVGKVWETRAGRADNLAGGTGVIYLPRIFPGTLTVTSPTEETMIEFPAEVLAANPELAGTEVMVPANALFANDGTRGGRVGIAPVPPDRLPSPLPDGFSAALVITIQTDGATNFDQPVPVTFPNLPDPVTGERLPPGAASTLWSFDHDVGDWEVAGPMTVSADGLFVRTDPGVGVRQPGWHFPSPPAVQGTGGGAAPFPPGFADNPLGGGPGEGGIPGPGGSDGSPEGGGNSGGGGGGGSLLGGPGSDYGPGHEGCEFSHIVDPGMLIPGSVTHIGPATITAGVGITFMSDGARDTGGIDGINCPTGPEDFTIPPGPIDYTWIITKDGQLVSQGFGLTASVNGSVTGGDPVPGVVNGLGTYQVNFFGLPRRYAIRDDVVDLGTSSVTVVPPEEWVITPVDGAATSIVPELMIGTLETALSLIPGVEVEFNRDNTSASIELGVRTCFNASSGAAVVEGESYESGTIGVSAEVSGPLWPGFGYVEKIRVTILGARVRLEIQVGATVSANIAFSISGGQREDLCRPEACGFAKATLGFTVTAQVGYKFDGLVAIPGFGIYDIPEQNIDGISATLGASGTLSYNGNDNCWRGFNGSVAFGETKIVVLAGTINVPIFGSFPLPGHEILAGKAVELKWNGNNDPLANG